MRVIKGNSAEQVWLDALRDIKSAPMVSPRNKTTTERSPLTIVLEDIHHNIVTNPYRNMNHTYALIETLWVLKGRTDLEYLLPYNKRMGSFSDDGVELSGAYGPQFVTQRQYVFNILKNDRNSRQAVMTIWKPNPAPSKDVPCTVMLHFLIRDGKLDLIVYMRSNDLWLGFPYDLYLFTTIQKLMACSLKVKYGTYTHITGSMHLYEEDWVGAEWALKYPGPILTYGRKPNWINVDSIVNVERDIRKSTVAPPHWTAYFDWGEQQVCLLTAYWRKKRRCKDVIFPEPYETLRRYSREIRAKVGGSKDTRELRGDEGDTPKC